MILSQVYIVRCAVRVSIGERVQGFKGHRVVLVNEYTVFVAGARPVYVAVYASAVNAEEAGDLGD